MSEALAHHYLAGDGVQLHAVCAEPELANGKPPVILCHGMPGLWFSWRHQLPALAAAGYFAIAIDQRGYGRSDRPSDVNAYTSTHTVQDLCCVLDYFDAPRGYFVGQDFGAAQVYNLALRQPDKVAGLVGMACPYDFDFSGRSGSGLPGRGGQDDARAFARSDKKPSECFAAIAEHQFFYAHYYQTIGPAEQEFANAPEKFLRRLFWALSAKGRLLEWSDYPKEVQGYIDVLAEPERKPPWHWMSEDDIQFYVDEFMNAASGKEFIGGLNAYRAADANWQLTKATAASIIEPPSLFIAGAEDPVIKMIDPSAFDVLQQASADLRGIHLIADAGHFVQAEQAEQCNKHLIEFLDTLTE
ncbi:MAG: alpha/beta fold hydrolase [Pseudomonadales bacterium]